jgi:hypothetical protein
MRCFTNDERRRLGALGVRVADLHRLVGYAGGVSAPWDSSGIELPAAVLCQQLHEQVLVVLIGKKRSKVLGRFPGFVQQSKKPSD